MSNSSASPVQGPAAPESGNNRIWRIIATIAAVLVGLLLIATIVFVIWASNAAEPMPEALAALESNAAVTVSAEPWLTFTPTDGAPDHGFIFYPGGKVDPRAYAPAAQAIAAAGYQVVITPMPLNLAVFAPNRADRVIEAFPEVERWSIGGHSLGGAMAASYVFQNPGALEDLIFWAAFPPGNSSLADAAIDVLSVSGTLDGLATPSDIEASRPLLPSTAQFVPIDGGNHAQFGWYGSQAGDNPATISREEQQQQAIAATLATLASPPAN